MNAAPLAPAASDRKLLNVRAAICAGILGSLVFQLLEICLMPLAGGSGPWGPARMIAAMVMGPRVLPPPATFDAVIVSVAFLVDIVLAIIYACVIGALIQRWQRGNALLVGAIFGAALYWINFHVFTEIFPWFALGRNWVTILTHVIFSVTVVATYLRFSREPTAPVRAD